MNFKCYDCKIVYQAAEDFRICTKWYGSFIEELGPADELLQEEPEIQSNRSRDSSEEWPERSMPSGGQRHGDVLSALFSNLMNISSNLNERAQNNSNRAQNSQNYGPDFEQNYWQIHIQGANEDSNSDDDDHHSYQQISSSPFDNRAQRDEDRRRFVMINNNNRNMHRLNRIHNLTDILNNLMQELSVGRQEDDRQPASHDTIENLKEVEITESDYEKKDTTNEDMPPACPICTDEMDIGNY